LGPRYWDGQHQALEAEERGQIHLENQTLSQITFSMDGGAFRCSLMNLRLIQPASPSAIAA
jgi:hypothetical protein